MMRKQNDEPDIEEDSDEYVMLKVPYIFHIKYNSLAIWDKLSEEERADYDNFEEFYRENISLKWGTIGYLIGTILMIFLSIILWLYIIYMITGFNIFTLFI